MDGRDIRILGRRGISARAFEQHQVLQPASRAAWTASLISPIDAIPVDMMTAALRRYLPDQGKVHVFERCDLVGGHIEALEEVNRGLVERCRETTIPRSLALRMMGSCQSQGVCAC